MLEQFGIIVAPMNVNDMFYRELTWALFLGRKMHPERRLELRCHGEGGLTTTALAIVDLIRLDGNIDGVLIGDAASSHGFIWAACARRYVSPLGVLKVHGTAFGSWNQRLDEDVLIRQGHNFTQTNRALASIYAKASNKSKKWWYKRLKANGVTSYEFTAKDLIRKLKMARSIKGREE